MVRVQVKGPIQAKDLLTRNPECATWEMRVQDVVRDVASYIREMKVLSRMIDR